MSPFPSPARLAIVGFLALSLSGCIGPKAVQQECHLLARACNFEQALTLLDKSALAKSRKNRLLYLMERGTLLHLKGDWEESNRELEEADRLSEELFTRSLSAEGLSFITNDNVIAFAGEDYEAVFLNYLKTLNFLALGDLGAAAVESRRVDEKLNWYVDRYGERNVYREDAFLRLLTGLIYEAQGDSNNAFIAYRKSLEAYRASRTKYGVAVPGLLWSRLLTSARRTGLLEEARQVEEEAREAGVEPTAEGTVAALLVNRGSVPVKREEFILIPTEHGFPVKIAVPRFEPSAPPAGPVEVALDGSSWQSAERVQDVAAIARQSLSDKEGRVLAKAVARAVAKQLAARQAQKEKGPLAGLAVQLAALLTENADLRSWSGLPAEIWLAVLPVEPGSHTVTLRAGGASEVHSVDVAADSVGFVFTRLY